jgi:MATE family multidrug resistance protein
MTAVAGGIFRGTGRAHIGAAINLTSYYLVGIPAGLVLCFTKAWGLTGLWFGLTLALAINSMVTNLYGLFINVDLEAERAQTRAAQEISRLNAAAALRKD